MDLSEVIEAYLVESDELLNQMETVLLKVEKTKPTDDDLNAIFRSVHTIKGTAGMFGFSETVRFAHVLENVLDKLRSGERSLNDDLCEILLKAKDHLQFLVKEESSGGIPKQKIEEGDLLLLSLEPNTNTIANKTPKSPLKEEQSDSPTKTSSLEQGVSSSFLISFRPNKNVFSLGLDPISFLTYLKRFGKIKSLFTLHGSLEPTESYNPEDNYLGFEILFETDANTDTIRESFAFIENDSFLHILSPPYSVEDLVDTAKQLPEEEIFLGEIWKELGLFTGDLHVLYLNKLREESAPYSPSQTK